MNRYKQNKGPTPFGIEPFTSDPARVALRRHEAGVHSQFFPRVLYCAPGLVRMGKHPSPVHDPACRSHQKGPVPLGAEPTSDAPMVSLHAHLANVRSQFLQGGFQSTLSVLNTRNRVY